NWYRLASVVAPGIGVQRRVPETPDRGSMELVGSRTRGVLDRTVAAPHFYIDGGQDQPDFANEIGIDCGDRVNAVRAAVIVHVDTVANDHDVVGADAGECGVFTTERVAGARRIRRHDVFDAGHNGDEIQDVVSNVRQGRDL